MFGHVPSAGVSVHCSEGFGVISFECLVFLCCGCILVLQEVPFFIDYSDFVLLVPTVHECFLCHSHDHCWRNWLYPNAVGHPDVIITFNEIFARSVLVGGVAFF